MGGSKDILKMSSQSLKLREDLKTIFSEYRKLDPKIRKLDTAIVGLTALFTVNFLLITVSREVDSFTIKTTPANMALMVFPIFLAGLLMFARIDASRAIKKGVKKEERDAIVKKSMLDLRIGFGILVVLLLLAIFFPY
ncbi:MAG: hypothetical protein D6732_00805 [Methanobacteriota archaeon]|nr:MAG: hypothetical protein D6732_00805 [Euryarchaeota archaeon]